jgi:hypothetical protein
LALSDAAVSWDRYGEELRFNDRVYLAICQEEGPLPDCLESWRSRIEMSNHLRIVGFSAEYAGCLICWANGGKAVVHKGKVDLASLSYHTYLLPGFAVARAVSPYNYLSLRRLSDVTWR